MLTDQDKKWLNAISESHQSWTPLILAEIRGADPRMIKQYAGDILVYYNYMFVTARQLVEAAIREASIKNSQVSEAYEYGCACAVHNLAKKLSPTDARALVLASDYHACDLDVMDIQADEAVREARKELYGQDY